MNLYEEKKACCGCGACADSCPVDAISMKSDDEGFLYPQADREKCIGCGRCIQVCPLKAEKEARGQQSCFGAQAKRESVRGTSSSGGVFPILAEYVFRRQGVVYGAAYSRDMKVVHREAGSAEELEALKRTKYVQSDLQGIYRSIRERLKEGRWVLFCGTPCQAHGLRLFLGEPHSRLITADLVCYGVPSPGIWRDYVKYLERKSGGKMTDFSFRDKRNRDNGHSRSYVAGGRERADSLYADIYSRMYFADYTIRPSCYECGYCTPDRHSDFTLGDFWGIEKVRPDRDDGMGTSLVILHTDKAREVWEQVKEELDWFSCSKKDVLQPRLKGPTEMPAGREGFMKRYKALPFSLFRLFFAWGMFVRDLRRRAGWR